MLGFFGKLIVGFFIVLVVLGAVGLWMRKRSKEKKEYSFDKTFENVADLNDRFNRARYQDQDGE